MDAAPLIELRRVVKTLGPTRVLDGVDLKIYRGEITAVIGKSGSGKSVLLKHIIGLYEPDEGDILIEGQRRAERTAAESGAQTQVQLRLPGHGALRLPHRVRKRGPSALGAAGSKPRGNRPAGAGKAPPARPRRRRRKIPLPAFGGG